MHRRNYYVYIMGSLSRSSIPALPTISNAGSSSTRKARPARSRACYRVNRLVYYEEFSDINQAIARAKELKNLTRKPDQAARIDQTAVAGFEPGVRSTQTQNPGFLARQPRAGMTEVESTSRPEQSPATAPVAVSSHSAYG